MNIRERIAAAARRLEIGFRGPADPDWYDGIGADAQEEMRHALDDLNARGFSLAGTPQHEWPAEDITEVNSEA